MHVQAPASASPSGPRQWGLDVIRGVAIVLVLCRHLHLAAPEYRSSWFHQLLYFLQRGGWCGVDLFFVLSGFLVSTILFRQYQQSGSLQVKNFLVRRAFKIYPAFWILLEVTILYNLMAGGAVNVSRLLSEVCFVQNYWPGLYGHTWSLAVEEHCYLGLVLLLGCCIRVNRGGDNPFRLIPWIAIAGTILVACLRYRLSAHLVDRGPPSILFPTHLRFDGFLWGTAFAWLKVFHRSMFDRFCQVGRSWWILAGFIALSPVFVWDIRRDPIVVQLCLTTNICAALCWIAAASCDSDHSGEQRMRAARRAPNIGIWVLAFIGQHSYSIYLWHDFLDHVVVRRLVRGFVSFPVQQVVLWVPSYMIITILGGIILSRIVERPALAWRDRWYPAPRPA